MTRESQVGLAIGNYRDVIVFLRTCSEQAWDEYNSININQLNDSLSFILHFPITPSDFTSGVFRKVFHLVLGTNFILNILLST